jgi:DNA replication protein DnaC
MKDLKALLEELKLHKFSEELQIVLDQNSESAENVLKALNHLCRSEIAQRHETSIRYRIDQARFGQIQTVDTFDFTYNASTQKAKSRYLKLLTPEVVAQGLSVLFVGSSGLGKTHLARALGHYFCQQRQRVRFSSLSAMSLDLTTSDSTGTLKKTMMSYTQPALLILDEIGYVSLRELECNLAFQIISQRYEARRSTVITTNRPFGEWNQIFHNDAMAHALIDRLIERSEVFHLEGPSYRETHRKRLRS